MHEALSLAIELMRCRSVTPIDDGCQALIADYLTKLGFQCEFMPFGDVSNLYVRFGTEAPLFIFAGHTDVVPPGDELAWRSPPFSPEIRDGILFGRGASDMKAAIAAMLVATKRFLEIHSTIKGSIGFLLTSDEEGPAIHGTKCVVDALLARNETIDYCVIGEPSSIERVGDQVRVGRRGSLHGRVTVYGKQGHVAHPHLAMNAIHEAFPGLVELTQVAWDEGNSDFPPTSFQISNVHSGTGALNVIPGDCVANFNFRFSTASTVDSLRERVQTILAKHYKHFDIAWEVGALPFLTQAGRLRTEVQTAIREVTELSTILSTGGGTSDGRFIVETGAEIIELGLSHATAHHVDEAVRAADVEVLTAVYEAILRRLMT